MFVGIDVAKAELVVATRPGLHTWTAANDDAGIRGLVQRVAALQPTLIVLEATGGGGAARFTEAARPCGLHCTWLPSWPPVAIP